MKALQLIYTSWKNGDSQEKGYMVYSKSEGITSSEVEDIKRVMKYIPPRGLNATPSEEEIKSEFPYNFSYFKLNSGRVCLALSSYLGKDYSNRFGNYIIYALVFEDGQLVQYPYEFFGESFMKTEMTEEELCANSPVPPLQVLDIDYAKGIITDDILVDFVTENEEQAVYVISAALQARKENVPFYINDTRENTILWIAVITRIFPVSLARNIYYSSYIFDQEKFRHIDNKQRELVLDIQGVRSDANNFSYQSAAESTNQIVMDSINGIITKDVEILDIAKVLIEDFTIGMDDIESFGIFLDEEGLDKYSYELTYAYNYYKTTKYKQFDCNCKYINELFAFGKEKLSESTNSDMAIILIEILKQELERTNLENIADIITYIYSCAGFMAYSVHSILFDYLFKMAEVSEDVDIPFRFLDRMKNQVPESYKDMLNYFVSGDLQSQLVVYFLDNDDLLCNLFFLRFIVRNYHSNEVLNNKCRELFLNCTRNLARIADMGLYFRILLSDAEKDDQYLILIVKSYSIENNVSNEELANALSIWIKEDLLPEQSKHVIDVLMSDDETVQVAINVISEYIRCAEDKYSAFWHLYNNNSEYFTGKGSVNLDHMLDAYIDDEFGYNEAREIITRIPFELLVKYKSIESVLKPIETESIKTLLRDEKGFIKNAADLAVEAGLENRYNKMVAAANADGFVAATNSNESFSELMIRYPVIAINLEKKEYSYFLDNYLNDFVNTITNKEEIEDLFNRLCIISKNSEFYEAFNSCLKKVKKGDEHYWLQLVTWICELLMTKNKSKVVSDYQPYFFRYLRKLDSDDYEMIKSEVTREIPEMDRELFFEKALEKESMMDRVGGLFKKTF